VGRDVLGLQAQRQALLVVEQVGAARAALLGVGEVLLDLALGEDPTR